METGLNSCFIVRFEDVIATAPVITDDDILEQFQKDHSPEFDEEDGCDDESLNDEVPELNDLLDQK